LQAGIDLIELQQILGHVSLLTTEIYTHIMKKDIDSVKSPLDLL
jgi:site-specific recombinase XerD